MRVRFLWIALLVIFISLPALAQETTNTEIRVVPATREVAIDGNLEEWDLSGGIFMCYDAATLADKNSVWAYMMHDEEALYVAFRFKDRTPLINHIDPKVEPGFGWRSDCVHMRIWTDKVLHVDSYFYTDEKRPVVRINYEDLGLPAQERESRTLEDAIAEGARAAFRVAEDGKGYTQEIALPWRLLRQDGKAYKVGESLRCGIECLWGDPTGGAGLPAHRIADLLNPELMQRTRFWGNKNAWGTARLVAENDLPPSPTAKLALLPSGEEGELTLEERMALKRTATTGPVELAYELPHKAYVTLVIEDEQGKRVRNLIADAFRLAGRNVDYWEGADDEGRLVTPGRYQVRGLYHKEFEPVYEFTFGSPGNPPWETADGRGAWLSDHAAPEAVAADDERIYLAAPNAEAGSAVLAMDYAGQKIWGIGVVRVFGYSGTALAVGDEHLFVAIDSHRDVGKGTHLDANLTLYRVDKKTGAYAPFPDGEAFHVVGKHDRSLLPRPRSEGDWIASGDHNPDWARCSLMGLAYHQGKLYMSSYLQDRILVIDAEKGETEGEISIPAPVGLAVDPKGRLLAVSGKQVMVIETQTGKTEPLISDLEAPVALTTDRQGNIYVSDWAREMCVKVYSPDGKFLRRIGKRGGRPWVGAWDPNGMLLPSSLAVDRRDRLWVAEKDLTPKRVSVWSATGEFEREFIGPPFYKNVGTHVNPYDPTQAFVTNCEVQLDWETGEWHPVATIWRPTHPMALFGPNRALNGSYRTIRLDGREFMVSSSSWVIISERKDDQYQPVAALGHVGAFVHRSQTKAMNHLRGERRLPVPILDEHRTPPQLRDRIKEPDMWKSYPEETTNFYWADRNGDALVQENEMTFFEAPGAEPQRWNFLWANPVSGNLTIYPYNVWGGREIIWRVPLKGWTECGAPLYDPQNAEIVINRARKQVPGRNSSASWVFSGERVLSTEVPLALFDRDGEVLWTYPNDWPGMGSHVAPAAHPGRVIGTLYTLGEADLGGTLGTIFALRGNMGEDFLFTVDGLFVANLFRDGRAAPEAYPSHAERGMVMKGVSTGDEPFGGTLFQDPDTGKVYVTAGDRGPSIFEIRGLESIRRMPPSEIEFSVAQYKKAEQILTQKAAEETPLAFALRRAPRKPRIDGDLGDFHRPSEAGIYLDENHNARAWASYDNKNLYLAYQVHDRMLLANGGQDWMILFKTGSAVDFQIGVDPEANPNRSKPVAGDQRIIIAHFQGKLTAVLYNYVVPGAKNPQSFSSGVGTVVVDVVRRIEEAEIAVTKGKGEYILEVAIPLEALAFDPKAGQKLKGDFGVIWSGPMGQRNAARCYWSNKAAGIVSDLPSEIRINPNMWGEIEIAQ